MDYQPQIIDGKMAVWLQAVGWVEAKKATDIKIGDVLMYNYAQTAEVIDVVKETAKTIVFLVKCKSGVYEQRVKKTTWKAVV